MKTLRQQLVERHRQIKSRGGKVPTAKGTLERQLADAQAECDRLLLNEQGDGLSNTQKKIQESRRTVTQALYESMGLAPEQAKIAAKLERGVVTGNANRIFEAGLAMGMSIVEARIFSNPNLTLEEAKKQ